LFETIKKFKTIVKKAYIKIFEKAPDILITFALHMKKTLNVLQMGEKFRFGFYWNFDFLSSNQRVSWKNFLVKSLQKKVKNPTFQT
jgi:hypothetical protein